MASTASGTFSIASSMPGAVTAGEPNPEEDPSQPLKGPSNVRSISRAPIEPTVMPPMPRAIRPRAPLSTVL